MKQFIKTSLLFLFIFSCSYSFGQNAIGVKFGGNLATWNGDEEILGGDPGSNLGFLFGGVFEINISDLISIQPELLYLQKGIKDETSFNDPIQGPLSSKSKITLNYIELPILLKLKFGDTQGTNFFFTAGPSFGYAANGKSLFEFETVIDGETIEDDIEFDDEDEFSRLELSASLGAGVSFSVGPGKLFFETRYLLGVTNLVDDETDAKIKNVGFSLSAGFLFSLGK